MRENSQVKAARLCASGRVAIRSITDDMITATVRGDSGRVYEVVLDPAGWHCPCDAASIRCSHVQAVQLVTLEPRITAGQRG